MELKDYIMSQPYREFSEFNCLGFYLYEYHRDKFEWFDTSKHPESEWPTLTVDQCWSWGGLTDEIKAKWENILSGNVLETDEQNSMASSEPEPYPCEEQGQHYVSLHHKKSGAENVRAPAQNFQDNGDTRESLVRDTVSILKRLCTAPAYIHQVRRELREQGVIK